MYASNMAGNMTPFTRVTDRMRDQKSMSSKLSPTQSGRSPALPMQRQQRFHWQYLTMTYAFQSLFE